MVVDTHKDRLALAEKVGAIAVDDTEGSGVEKVMELTGGKGADRGCAYVKAYNRLLSRLIEKDKVKPSWLVSHELPLERAAEAYESFDQRKKGWTKVVLKPGG
jgi:threonine dehydrogenase-like Zn-dependent dehydrogenase